MADWDNDAPATEAAPAQPGAAAPAWSPNDTAAEQPYSGSILPFSRDSSGNVSFDPSAGILGKAISGLTLPGDVATGKVDPMSTAGITRAADMAAIATPVAPGAGMARAGVAPIPSTQALQDAAGAGYDAARAMGVEYSPTHVADMAQGVQSNLLGTSVLPSLAPQTHAVLNSLQAVPSVSQFPPGANATVPGVRLGDLDAARKILGKVSQNFNNPIDAGAAKQAQAAIDDFVTNPPQNAVMAGPAAAAADTITDARANAAAAFRSDRLNGVADAADLRASAANSGANIGNSTRQRIASLLLNPKTASGFNDEETDALRGVVQGSPVANALRTSSNLIGGGGGLGKMIADGAGVAIGAHFGGTEGAVMGGGLVHGLGSALKSAQNSADTKALSAADELVRSRSPLADALAAQTPPVLQQYAGTQAIARALAAPQAPAPVWQPGQEWNPANPMGGGSI